MSRPKSTDRRQPGPDPERLKLPFKDWKNAIREALKRERPSEGWPDNQGDDEQDANNGKED